MTTLEQHHLREGYTGSLTQDASSIHGAAEGCNQPVHELYTNGSHRCSTGAQESRLGFSERCQRVSTYVVPLLRQSYWMSARCTERVMPWVDSLDTRAANRIHPRTFNTQKLGRKGREHNVGKAHGIGPYMQLSSGARIPGAPPEELQFGGAGLRFRKQWSHLLLNRKRHHTTFHAGQHDISFDKHGRRCFSSSPPPTSLLSHVPTTTVTRHVRCL